MDRKNPSFITTHFATADELWLALSPTNELSPFGSFIYRGQADAAWPLLPSLLRPGTKPPIGGKEALSIPKDLLFHEIAILRRFANHCDTVGIRVPNDSPTLRKSVIEITSVGKYFKNPSWWPHPDALDLMALAQHHGVPTRLLDWSQRAFTAAYFAASSALARYESWTSESKLAVWALDQARLSHHPDIVIHRSPGSVSPHLAAQKGLFTVHPHHGGNAYELFHKGLEDYVSDNGTIPLIKLTIPSFEAGRLWLLCSKAGFNGANIYPSADGAGRAVMDDLFRDAAYEKWNETEQLMR
jgi:hypothetical protein